MTRGTLDRMVILKTKLSYDHVHLKDNLEKAILNEWNKLKHSIELMY